MAFNNFIRVSSLKLFLKREHWSIMPKLDSNINFYLRFSDKD